jgi:hypothetical protein
METYIMFGALFLFGIISYFLVKQNSKGYQITYLMVLSIALIILTYEAFINSDNRYISILFIVISIPFFLKQLKSIITNKTIPK